MILLLLLFTASWVPAETFRVATYNVENYLDQDTESRQTKPAAARAQVQENILALRPDVLALQEMGRRGALEELQSALKSRGLDLPHGEWVPGWDTNIFVAVLSRFPIAARRPHTNESYLLSGRRLHVSRGFAEVDVQVGSDYSFTLLTAHLKSKRQVGVGDEAEMRQEEARALRRIVDARLAAQPEANLVVCGDFNDTYNSPAVKTVVGRGRTALVDTRPAEQNGDTLPHPSNPAWFPRNVAWTHHYGVEDSYSRIDYLLVSAGMAREWETNGTYALVAPNWGQGSDHRPIVATFHIGDR